MQLTFYGKIDLSIKQIEYLNQSDVVLNHTLCNQQDEQKLNKLLGDDAEVCFSLCLQHPSDGEANGLSLRHSEGGTEH